MPTTLGPKYSIEWRGRPPHMLQEDIPVWYRFLEREGPAFAALYYDVLLGGPWLSPEEERDPLKKGWRANLAKRADAVAELSDELWIIEVALDPGLRSAGQLITYLALWNEDPKSPKAPRMILVSERLDPDLGAALGPLGVIIHIV